jgi:glycine/sarcosine N-methyltransferase
MARMIEPDNGGVASAAGFYDRLASRYDDMTGFEERFSRETSFFKRLIDQHGIQSALDAGCGTGFHALLLARLGVAVTAIDVSAKMLERLRTHAEELALEVRAIQSSFQGLLQRVTATVDAVFCLGNSLAHLLTTDDRTLALRNFASVLKPGGVLVLQTLNYDRILRERIRVQGVREAGGLIFVRFYDFGGELLRFNVMTLRSHDGRVDHTLDSVMLRPMVREEGVSMLVDLGMRNIRCLGGTGMEEFDPLSSKDLVLIAQTS